MQVMFIYILPKIHFKSYRTMHIPDVLSPFKAICHSLLAMGAAYC